MSELSNRMIRDMQLAGLVEGTRREYLRAVRQLAAYYMVAPDRLSERNVEDYLLYVRDELGVAKGTFAPIFAGLKFFYLDTLGYDWPLFTKKNKVGKLGWRQRSSSWLRNLAGSRRKRRCLRLVSRRLSNWARSRRQSSTYPVRGFSPSSGRSRVARLATTRTEPWTTKPDPPCCRPLARRSW